MSSCSRHVLQVPRVVVRLGGNRQRGNDAREGLTATAGHAIVTFAAAAGLVLSLTGCWNAPENLVPTPVPEPEDLVGAWINTDDGGRIDFRADGTCRLTDIPEGALSLDPPGPDGTPTGRPIDTEDCVWRVDEDDPGIDLARAAPCSTSGGTTAPKSGSGSVIPTSGTPTSL
jgi:hypothetical protein